MTTTFGLRQSKLYGLKVVATTFADDDNPTAAEVEAIADAANRIFGAQAQTSGGGKTINNESTTGMGDDQTPIDLGGDIEFGDITFSGFLDLDETANVPSIDAVAAAIHGATPGEEWAFVLAGKRPTWTKSAYVLMRGNMNTVGSFQAGSPALQTFGVRQTRDTAFFIEP